MHSLIHSCIHSFIHAFTHSFMHSLIHSFMHSLIHSCIHSFIHSCIHSFIHAFTHSVNVSVRLSCPQVTKIKPSHKQHPMHNLPCEFVCVFLLVNHQVNPFRGYLQVSRWRAIVRPLLKAPVKNLQLDMPLSVWLAYIEICFIIIQYINYYNNFDIKFNSI